MALLDRVRTPQERPERPEHRPPPRPRERRWSRPGPLEQRPRPSLALLVALVLASLTLITLDYRGGDDSPVEPARRAVGEVLGPVESVTAAAVRPFASVPDWFRSRSDLDHDLAALQAENSRLRAEVATAPYDRNRLAEYDGLTAAADDLGYALVPARVVALGPAQSFSDTVTIDAGSRAGLHADMTVLNNDGLVGRVLRVSATTATVLLAVDPDSVVGGRLARSMDVGFVHGRGVLGEHGRLDLELVDDAEAPAKHDTVVTWGSKAGAPYVAGVPVGEVTSVYSSVRETAQHAVIDPFVDFGSLDLVGVVVPSGTDSDRAVIETDGSLR